MTRWDANRRGVGLFRGIASATVLVLITDLAVFGCVYAAVRLLATHPALAIPAAAAVLGLYLWLFRDHNNTNTTTDDEDGAL